MAVPEYRKPLPRKYGSSVMDNNPYNPKITYYYNSLNQLVQVDEEYNGDVYRQTISGTTSSGIRSTAISYYEVHSPWTKI